MDLDQQHPLHSYASSSREVLVDPGDDVGLKNLDLISALIDGGVSQGINEVLGRERRRSDGIFFSGPMWASRLREAIPHGPFIRFFDPSCGVGDLLLEVARLDTVACELAETLADWEKRYQGADLHAPLAAVAWSRLQALAVRRHAAEGECVTVLNQRNIGFNALDSLEGPWQLQAGDCILMNPPYNSVLSPSWSKTCNGRVTAAALFLERAITDAPPGTAIVALLPEVIRSGSRFEQLRDLMASTCTVHRFEPQGRFSNEADIDVAVLSITKCDAAWSQSVVKVEGPGIRILDDLASVGVGTVVPYRALSGLARRPYVDVERAPVWKEIFPGARERYLGRAFKPPFVVVRRTSSPGDRERARATVVRGKEPVMVENHLLVLIPKRQTLKNCRDLMRVLRDQRTTSWLNEMLRCRHLTVRVMKQLPIWTEN